MNLDDTMRQREAYHSLVIPDNLYVILRIDGRAFHTHVKEEGYERPYSNAMRDKMINATRTLLKEFDGVLGYTQSDEISILLPRHFDLYHRSVEKLVSISSSIATYAYFPTESPAYFDSRIWLGATERDVSDYFLWRIMDSYRNFLSGVVYHEAKKRGYTKHQSTKLGNAPAEEKMETLYSWGMTPRSFPNWMKQGTILLWEEYQKKGFNPITEEDVIATRRHIIEREDIPKKYDQISEYILNLI